MAQFIVRQLDEGTKNRLKRRAQLHGRSVEAEIRDILRSAVATGRAARAPLGTRIAQRFRAIGLTKDIPEFHGQAPRGADLGK